MKPWSCAIASAFSPIALMALVALAGGLSIQPARATLLYTMTADSGFALAWPRSKFQQLHNFAIYGGSTRRDYADDGHS